MKKLIHTRGPWGVDQNFIVSKSEKDGGWPILAIKPPESHETEHNWEANSKLMALAPELLSALKIAHEAMNKLFYDLQDNKSRKIAFQVESLIHNTIKKATGEK